MACRNDTILTIARKKMIQTAYLLKDENELKTNDFFVRVFERFFHERSNAIFENLLRYSV
jgi:hypothetical protein